MNVLRHFFIVVYCIFPFLSFSQEIKFNFPKFSGKSFEFIIFQGEKNLAIATGVISDTGIAKVSIPNEYEPYYGMGRWLITNSSEGGGLDLLINGKDFSISCDSDQPNENNIYYFGNEKINELKFLRKEQQEILERYHIMKKATLHFSKEDQVYSVFLNELKKQENLYGLFSQKIRSNSSIVNRFLVILNITMGLSGEVLEINSNDRNLLFDDIMVKDLDWELLYTSGHWSDVIISWVHLHTEIIKDRKKFLVSFSKISEKIHDVTKRNDFHTKVAYLLTKKNMEDWMNGKSDIGLVD